MDMHEVKRVFHVLCVWGEMLGGALMLVRHAE